MPADTIQRRALRFERVEDVLAEAERLVVAEREGQLLLAGNWPLGLTLGHLATWANFAFDGYPPAVRAPLPVRMVLRLMRGRILSKGMMPGVRIRGVPEGTVGLEPRAPDEGLAELRAALERLRSRAPKIENPAFGPLTHEQWIQLNLRHAELHLGHLVPRLD
jgi:hypothetical protein